MTPDANGWLPIAEAPKNDVLILTDGGSIYQGFWNGLRWMTGFVAGPVSVQVHLEPTHWRPLLEGPVK